MESKVMFALPAMHSSLSVCACFLWFASVVCSLVVGIANEIAPSDKLPCASLYVCRVRLSFASRIVAFHIN